MPVLHWLNRNTNIQVPSGTLEEVPSLSYGAHDTSNMLIQGDNLVALNALLPRKVKCVFIDPPYNSKSVFRHFEDDLEHGEWLNMIYPRLELLRELLAEDGSIWVTIDDSEAHYLKVIMDEIFGRDNFVANCIWEKKYAPQNNARWLSDNHDHILVFAKNKKIWRPNQLPRTAEMDERYKNIDNDPRGAWKSGDLSVMGYTAGNDYPITTPSGRVVIPPKSRCWRVSEKKFLELVQDNRIWFGKDGANVPALKRFLSEVKQGVTAKTIWPYREVGHTQDAKREIMNIHPTEVFDTPKPEKLLKRILELASNENDLVLDCFLGSGTTAAVAHKMNRRYIGIEMGKHIITHCIPRLRKIGSNFKFYGLTFEN